MLISTSFHENSETIQDMFVNLKNVKTTDDRQTNKDVKELKLI